VRVVTGVTVFAGMLGVTLFGLFLTPVFYVALRRFAGWRRGRQTTSRKGDVLPGSVALEVGHG
jgi:hypothetical protein